MNDITIIFLTANKVPEKWAEYHKKILLKAIGNTPIITISAKPLNWGLNLIQTEYSVDNIYRQMLRGAKTAKTPFIAIAEDDTLYTKEHFEYRPLLDEFAYNMNRWSITSWVSHNPIYFWRRSVVNASFIGPRQLTIEALEERYSKYPNGIPEELGGELGRSKVEQRLGTKRWKHIEFYSSTPILGFKHSFSIDPAQQHHKKKRWPVQAYDIPIWRKAEDMIKKFV